MISEFLKLLLNKNYYRELKLVLKEMISAKKSFYRFLKSNKIEYFLSYGNFVHFKIIKNNNKILLARSKNWQQNLYSCIAGFCEPNESLEQTVIREAYEEVGLKLVNINYLFSQFWPFANNLMVGFEATTSSAKLKINESEIEDAIWVTKKELLNRKNKKEIILPKKYAIAHSLITHWQKI